MSKVDDRIAYAFMNKINRKENNCKVENDILYLFGNKIAKWVDNEVYISLAGWATNTTKNRLNALPNVNIHYKKGSVYLNGKEIEDYGWYKVNDFIEGEK